MAAKYRQLIRELEIATGEGNKVQVVTAAETIQLSAAHVHELDPDLLTGTTSDGRMVLVHGSTILAAYTDVEPST
jgi:hypothetical protein